MAIVDIRINKGKKIYNSYSLIDNLIEALS